MSVHPFDSWWDGFDCYAKCDPGRACAQRAWNAALEQAASHVANRDERTAILIDAVHMDDLVG